MPKQQLAKVIPISNAAPKACEWTVTYVRYLRGGVETYSCMIFNYDKGLTAFEAWEVSAFPDNPPYHECTFEMMCSYPCPDVAKELKIHGQSIRQNGSRTQRVSAVIARKDSGFSPKIPHTT